VILLVTFALSWLAALFGLVGRSVEAAQQFGAIVVIPVFLSSALVPTATMLPWLCVVTASQPITQAIDTLRALLAGHLTDSRQGGLGHDLMSGATITGGPTIFPRSIWCRYAMFAMKCYKIQRFSATVQPRQQRGTLSGSAG
jgi:hypothetical protein